MIILALVAFLVGVSASALVLAVRERRQSAALRDRVLALTAEADMLERRDGDTGLWNSRHFVEALTREIERARTYGRPVALALASLDVACRVGSTEFGVIMAETDSRSASVAAERVLRAMARVRTPSGLQTQASVGIAACPAHAETFDALVERAGSALRQARRAVRREQPKTGTVTVSMAVWDDAAAED